MRAARYCVVAAALAGLLGQAGGLPAARAQGGPNDETVLLVGVTHGTRVDPRLGRTLEEHLRLTGEVMASSARLTSTERVCSDGECLEQLAHREHAVLAITANVRDSGPKSYFLTLALVDAQRRLPVQNEAVCDTCTPDELATKLNELSDKTIHLYRERRNPPASALPAPATDNPPSASVVQPPGSEPGARAPADPQSGGPFTHLTTRRKIIAGVLGAAALGVLIPSIFWSLKDGQPAPPPCSDDPTALQDCRYDNRVLYGIGYATTVALTGGLLLTLIYQTPGSTPPSASAPVAEKAP
jgi:hypothetical protein